MFIKKVVVTWQGMTNYYPTLRILFYDQDGNLFESGSTISSTDKKAETDNFIVTVPNGAVSTLKYPINAISTEVYKDMNNASLYYFAGPSSSATFTIEFKTNQLISKIKVCTRIAADSTPGATLRVIDINDNEESHIINNVSDNVGTAHE